MRLEKERKREREKKESRTIGNLLLEPASKVNSIQFWQPSWVKRYTLRIYYYRCCCCCRETKVYTRVFSFFLSLFIKCTQLIINFSYIFRRLYTLYFVINIQLTINLSIRFNFVQSYLSLFQHLTIYSRRNIRCRPNGFNNGTIEPPRSTRHKNEVGNAFIRIRVSCIFTGGA